MLTEGRQSARGRAGGNSASSPAATSGGSLVSILSPLLTVLELLLLLLLLELFVSAVESSASVDSETDVLSIDCASDSSDGRGSGSDFACGAPLLDRGLQTTSNT